MPTPTIAQHALTNSNQNFEGGNVFQFALPDASLTGNCIAFAILYEYSATRAVAITDDQSNTWPAPTKVIDDTTNLLTMAAYVLPNAAAGTRVITVTFDSLVTAGSFVSGKRYVISSVGTTDFTLIGASSNTVGVAFTASGVGSGTGQAWPGLLGFAASVVEAYNVATSSPGDGSNGATAAVPAASGSITTTTNGDLILHWGFATGWGNQLNAGFNSGATTWTKASGFTKLHGNKEMMFFCEYAVQATAGAINPSSSFSGGTANTETFSSITIALKNASAGTAPAAGIRVYGITHGAFSNVSTNGNYTAWTPFAGNLGVLITSYPSSGLPINSATGAVAGAFTLVAPSAPSGIPQAVYKIGMSSSDDEVLTVNLNTGSSGKLQFNIYDVVWAGAFDTTGTAVLGSFSAGPVAHCPDITPGISAGLTIATGEFGTGPPSAVTSPTGALFDCGFYSGYTDLSPWDSGDAMGHLKFSSNAAQNWTWTDTQATGNANGLALTFGGGPAINTQPSNQLAAPGQSVTFSVSATASSGSLTYQWYRNGASVSGATSSSYAFTPNYPADYGALWYCVVTDSAGSNQTLSVAVLWSVQTQFAPWKLALLDAGDQDYKSELTLKRWF